MNKPLSEHPKLLLDPYLAWAEKEGVPITEDFGIDLLKVPTARWPRFGVEGAIAHLKGRGDFVSIFVLDLAPAAKTSPQRHLYEEVVYVLSGLRQHHGRSRATAASTASNGGRRACSRCRSTPATSISTPAAASARGSPPSTISA